jgi:hypothetical protein
MVLACVFMWLTVSGTGHSGESSAEVTELPERDGELVGEQVVVLAELVVGAAQGPHDGLVRLGADPLALRQDNDPLANELAVALGQLRDLRRGLLAAYLSRHGSMINGNAIS